MFQESLPRRSMRSSSTLLSAQSLEDRVKTPKVRLGIDQLEDRLTPATINLVGGTLNVAFESANEGIELRNDGTTISFVSFSPITGAASYTTASVNRIVVTDTGSFAGQRLQFTAGTALTLSGGLSSTGVETVIFDNQITATGTSSIDVTAPQSVTVTADLTGGSGGLSLTGQGVARFNTVGVLVQNGAVVSATGAGPVSVTGTGSSGDEAFNYGVWLNGGQVTSAGSGAVSVTGTGGSGIGDFNYGVRVGQFNSAITSGSGALTVIGVGGGGGSSNIGVSIDGPVTSGGAGVLSVTGTGGSGSGGSNYGVLVIAGGQIASAGSGAVLVRGTGGSGSGSENYGVRVNGSGATISSGGGDLTVTGIEGGGINGSAIILDFNPVIRHTVNGNLTLVGNSMRIDGTSTVSAGTGTVTLRPFTNGTGINLGSTADPAGGPLSLSDAELDRITAGTLIIGSTTSGAITSSATISPAKAPTLHLITGVNVVDGNGATNNITATSLAVDAKTGIALQVIVSNLAANNTTSGDITFGDTVSGTDLTITTVDGVVGITNAGGAISVTNLVAAVNINENISATGDIRVEATETTGAASTLTLTANKSVISSGGSLDVRGGDNVLLDTGSKLQAATSVRTGVTINEGIGTFDFSGASLIAGSNVEITSEQNATLGAVTATGTVSIRINSVGSVMDGNGAATNITAAALGVSFGNPGSLGSFADPIDTKVSNFELNTSNNGTFAIANDSASLELGGVTAAASVGALTGIQIGFGGFQLTNTGSIRITTMGDTVFVDGGVDLTGTAITIGTLVTADGGNPVNLTATTGSITSTNGTALDIITTGIVSLNASTGVGSAVSPLNLSAGSLTTNTSSGNSDQFLTELDSLTIHTTDLNAGTGSITLASGTFFTASGGDILSSTTVANGAILAGVGNTKSVRVQPGGSVSPGNSPGILNSGDVVFTSGANFVVEANGNTPGTGHDQLNVTGTVDLGRREPGDHRHDPVESGSIARYHQQRWHEPHHWSIRRACGRGNGGGQRLEVRAELPGRRRQRRHASSRGRTGDHQREYVDADQRDGCFVPSRRDRLPHANTVSDRHVTARAEFQPGDWTAERNAHRDGHLHTDIHRDQRRHTECDPDIHADGQPGSCDHDDIAATRHGRRYVLRAHHRHRLPVADREGHRLTHRIELQSDDGLDHRHTNHHGQSRHRDHRDQRRFARCQPHADAVDRRDPRAATRRSTRGPTSRTADLPRVQRWLGSGDDRASRAVQHRRQQLPSD